ncbi:MAG: hypothetical protein E7567_06145 [Ruminococcaceae bacterium]|nr:hypothetical protein [Oscillospiraceae bacterium]
MSLYHESITMPTRKELLQRKRFLEKTKAKLERSLASSPAGRLSTSKKRYTTVAGTQTRTAINYYHVLEDGRRVYLSRSRQTTIAYLAQKEYARKALYLVTIELKQLNDVLLYCDTPKLEDAWQDFLPEKMRFVDPPVPSDEVFRQKWLSQEYERKSPIENDHRFPTEKGDMVCSKTEAQQADYMFYHGYDYLYEKRLSLIDGGRLTWRYPDFTILDPVTREEVVFEHFGMVDDEGYQHSMFDKIRLYEENGYVIGQNFLFTFETAEHPFTMDQFIRILEARFPR